MLQPVRVLVVDDSSFFRKRIRQVLEESSQIQVVGEASNGLEAVQLNRELSPDLITMDVAMPELDGIEAARRIMREQPTDIIMFSALTREGARSTLDALDAGAVDFLPKQSQSSDPWCSSGPLLRERVLHIAQGRRQRMDLVKSASPGAPQQAPRVRRNAPTELVVIGASTGGPVAVQDVLTKLDAGFRLPVLVAVHMPGTFTPTYAERLDGLCQLGVREAVDGDELRPGQVLIAPGGKQTEVVRRGGGLQVRVRDGGEHLYKPSVDVMFNSAAVSVGAGVLGIVLTGMGSDGAQGATAVKGSGGHVWAQDQASCVVYGMPQAVARNGSAERILTLADIGPALREVH